MSAEETIVIYADLGMSPYAWSKNSSDRSTYVGGNIADSKYGLSKVIGTSRPSCSTSMRDTPLRMQSFCQR
jgi:hypothetical protein